MELTHEEKIRKLSGLSEQELRQQLLIPLFLRMGFTDVVEFHHSAERGKDIVFKEPDHHFGDIKFIAVVVKTGDITGSTSGNNSFAVIVNQIEQLFNETYRHVYNVEEVKMDECIVVTSGRIKPGAVDSIFGKLQKSNLDKRIRQIIDRQKLIELVDKHYPGFWEEELNQLETLTRERNCLINNISKLLTIVLDDPKELKYALSMIPKHNFEVRTDERRMLARYIANFSYRSISIEKLDDYWAHDITLHSFGDVRSIVTDYRKKAQNILWAIEEILDIIKTVLTQSDPEKIIVACEQLSFRMSNNRLMIPSYDIGRIEDAWTDLQTYKRLMGIFEENNLVEKIPSLLDEVMKSTTLTLLTYFEQGLFSQLDLCNCKIKLLSNEGTFEVISFMSVAENEPKNYQIDTVVLGEPNTVTVCLYVQKTEIAHDKKLGNLEKAIELSKKFKQLIFKGIEQIYYEFE